MRSASSSPRPRKIRFSVTARQYRAAELEAARLKISVAELFRRREVAFLDELERRFAGRLPAG